MDNNETISSTDDSLKLLDSNIDKIREEIKTFQNKRRLLSASLLSSQYIQKQIETHNTSLTSTAKTPTTAARDEVSTLMNEARKHRATNYHRLAFSTTSFPWKDPNPFSDSPNLLGIRIDVCERNGAFAKPYYLLLRREKGSEINTQQQQQQRSLPSFSIYRHTIPPFVPMEKLAHRYLPQPRSARKQDMADDEIEMFKIQARTRRQNLPAFVRQLRKELAAWHVRRDSISWLQEKLGVTDNKDSDDNDPAEENATERQRTNPSTLTSLAATSLECRYVRLEWKDGRVGRFKISNFGLVERAVVIGDRGRHKGTEIVLMGGDRRVESLVDRLSST